MSGSLVLRNTTVCRVSGSLILLNTTVCRVSGSLVLRNATKVCFAAVDIFIVSDDGWSTQ